MELSVVGDVELEVVDTALGVVPDRQAEALLYGRLDASGVIGCKRQKEHSPMMIAGHQLQQGSMESRLKPSPADLVLARPVSGVAPPYY